MNKQKEPINISSLISAVACLVIGIILILNDNILDIVGYIVSGCLALYGIIRLLVLAKRKKKEIPVTFGEYMGAAASLVFAVLIAIFPKSVSITISLILGTIAIFIGINRLILGLTVRKIDNNGSKLFVLDSVLIVVLGILIITQKFLNLLGIFLVVYAISELFSYIYYKTQSKDYSEVFNKKISKEIKSSKSIEAVIDED